MRPAPPDRDPQPESGTVRRGFARPGRSRILGGTRAGRGAGSGAGSGAKTGRIWTALPIIAAAVIPLSFLGVFFIWPLARMVALGLITDGGWDLGVFGEVLTDSRTQRVIGQTLLLALGATAGAIFLGLPGAYVLYRRTFPGLGVVRALITVPFVLATGGAGVDFRSVVSS